MLSEIRIRNYALIEDLTVRFCPGLNVLSGETGAGKSIVVGALSLLLGERHDSDLIRTGADAVQVEGRFDLSQRLVQQCAGLGIPSEGEPPQLLLRRRCERAGRSAVFANDSSITLTILQRLGDSLVDLHGQHQHQLLLKPEVHLDVLDEYAGLAGERAEFADRFQAWQAGSAELVRLEQGLAQARARRELNEFQLRELGEAQVRPGEQDELKREQELLKTAERRFELAQRVAELLSEQEDSIMSLLGGASRALAELAELDGGLGGYRAGLEEARAVADDLWRELARYREAIEFSPERMEAANARLFLLEKLARKYGTSADQLPDLLTQVQAELDALDTDSSRRDALAAEIAEQREALMTAADALTRRRRRARSELEQRLKEEMGALGLGRATLALSLARPPDPSGIYDRGGHRCRMTSTGVDSAEFLFSANPGEELRPLRKVASGGELSRLMLAMKNVLAEADPVPTLVFDEIDVGIGGRVAEAVGKRLARLARVRQVVCITHLPQIAKYADCHMLVAKSTRAGRTSASIRALDRDARVAELARMSSGVEITPTSLALAREMLKSVVNRGD